MSVAVRRSVGVALLAGAAVTAAAGGWWVWPGLAAAGLYLLVGHVRLRAPGQRPEAAPGAAADGGGS